MKFLKSAINGISILGFIFSIGSNNTGFACDAPKFAGTDKTAPSDEGKGCFDPAAAMAAKQFFLESFRAVYCDKFGAVKSAWVAKAGSAYVDEECARFNRVIKCKMEANACAKKTGATQETCYTTAKAGSCKGDLEAMAVPPEPVAAG